MAMLYGQGLFKYEDKISKIWPEFAQNGKENVKICDVFRHESGLAYFTNPISSVRHAWTENLKWNKIGQMIEKEPLHFPNMPGCHLSANFEK